MMGFEKWTGVHDSPDQKKRIASARTAACTPLSVSPETESGTFSGSHGVYATTLESCTCADFARRRLPCKHVYRLAIELGLLDGSAASDSSKVKRPTPAGLSLKDAVAAVESAGEDAQRELHAVLYSIFYEKKAEAVGVIRSPEISALIEAGILSPCDDLHALLGAYRRNELRDALIAAGVSGFSKNARLDVLIGWICENVPGAAEIFPEAEAVRLSDPFLKPARKIYTYLNRRNESEMYVDEDGEVRELPKGSQLVATVKIGGGTELSIAFPDDEITALLDQYGVNRCRGWKP